MTTGPPTTPSDPNRRTLLDVTCLGCGCACDDLTVSVEQGRVIEVLAACAIGREWLLASDADPNLASATVEGRAVETRIALDRVISTLAGSKAPVIWGLTSTSSETVRAALELADTLKARVVLDRSAHELGRVRSFQENGWVSSTLGEVKNRADLVVFWGVDPLTTHPRHWERYSVETRGRFVPEGRDGRTVVVVDAERSATADRADLYIEVPAGRQIEALSEVRMRLRGVRGVRTNFPALEGLTGRMKAARYGALFFQAVGDEGARAGIAWGEASRLVRELNEFTRFVILGMGSPGNLGGAEAALTWQSGYLQGVDYRRGSPAPVNDLETIDDLLDRGEADSLLAVAPGLPGQLSPGARACLGSIPTVLIGPGTVVANEMVPTVALTTSTVGIDERGTVTRSDGVVLPLRPIKEPRFPGAGDYLRGITSALQRRNGGTA